MEITFLGTSCMTPTKDRNHSSILLNYFGEHILFDCGEGTQRQLKIADINFMKISKIIISHWHGDHVLGLPGLIQTMSAMNYEGNLKIYGPKGTKKNLNSLFKVFVSDKLLKYEVIEVKDKKKIIDTPNYYVESYILDHGVTCFGYKFIEKDKRKIDVSILHKLGIPEGPVVGKLQIGKDVEYKGKIIKANDVTTIINGRSIGIINDTAYCSNCIKIAKNVDLLISEAAYESSLENKAIEYKHMTGKQAALISSQNNVKKLILTHYSQRYKDSSIILDDAREVFNNTLAAHDFMKIKL